jgi:hypothetical protein
MFGARPSAWSGASLYVAVGAMNNCDRSTPASLRPNSGIGVVYVVFRPPLP